MIVDTSTWQKATDHDKCFPINDVKGYLNGSAKSQQLNFVMLDCYNDGTLATAAELQQLAADKTVVLCLSSTNDHAMPSAQGFCRADATASE